MAGALSGVASRCVVYPADTVKAQLQVQGALPGGGPRYSGALAAARGCVRSGGGRPSALYRGLGAVLLGVVPANAAYFGGYEGAKAALAARRSRRRRDGEGRSAEGDDGGSGGFGGIGGSNSQKPPLLSLDDVVVGCAAQLLAGVVYTPVDIVKERMQVQSIMASSGGGGGSNKGAGDVLRALLREGGGEGKNGSLRHLFRGYWATNAVWLPWNMLYVAGYEGSKRAARGWLPPPEGGDGGGGDGGGDGGHGGADERALPAWCVVLCSASAAAAAAVVTHPADVVKTRLQVLPAAGVGGAARPSAWRLARELVRAEGARALWSGLGARVANIAPGCALSWALYEQVKGVLPGGAAAVVVD